MVMVNGALQGTDEPVKAVNGLKDVPVLAKALTTPSIVIAKENLPVPSLVRIAKKFSWSQSSGFAPGTQDTLHAQSEKTAVPSAANGLLF